MAELGEWRLGQITTTVKRQALFLTHSCSCAFNPKENFVYIKHLLSMRVHFYQPLNTYVSALALISLKSLTVF